MRARAIGTQSGRVDRQQLVIPGKNSVAMGFSRTREPRLGVVCCCDNEGLRIGSALGAGRSRRSRCVVKGEASINHPHTVPSMSPIVMLRGKASRGGGKWLSSAANETRGKLQSICGNAGSTGEFCSRGIDSGSSQHAPVARKKRRSHWPLCCQAAENLVGIKVSSPDSKHLLLVDHGQGGSPLQ